ncbi:MAG: hypothetical protein PWP51_1237 [Clostridiales bacterium]|nr:hypothetical protein [Clostridiales bacterium]MDN5298684.1 hypothetical protein [Clostridiales bacterium]
MQSNAVIHKLNTILETSKLLNTTRDVTYILEALLQKSLELIEGGDTGVIFLYNPESGFLEVEAYVGFTETVEGIKLIPGESMTGTAFVNEKPMFFSTIEMVNQFMANMADDNRSMLEVSSAKGLHRLQGSIACPLIYQKVCIGTIVIDNFENNAPLVPEDVQILESISVQATIAIINARSYRREQENNAQLAIYNKMLEEERNKYKYSTGLHTKFTDMVLTGCTLNDIIMEVSELLHRDVLLIDLFFNVNVMAVNMIIDEKMMDQLKSQIKLDLMFQHTEQCRFASLGRYLNYYPILVNGEILGWLCIFSDGRPFSELDQIAIEKGSTILALELLKLDELSDMEQSFKGDFLEAILINHDMAYLQKCAMDFNFNFEHDHQMAIIGGDPLALHLQDDHYRRRLKQFVNHYYQRLNTQLNTVFPGSVAMIKDQEIVVIFELLPEDPRKHIIAFIEQFLYETDQMTSGRSNMAPLSVGISQVIRELNDFNSAYRNAQHTLKTLKNIMPGERYLFFDDLEVKQLLINNNQSTLSSFMDKVLGPLLCYDKRSKDDFLETLRIYIRSNGNWTYTKDKLHIHGNTLNYRLSRIMTLLNMDLNDYQQRLKIQIAFEILDIQKLQM